MSSKAWLHEEYHGMTVYQMLNKMTEKFQHSPLFSYWQDGKAHEICYVSFFEDVRRLAGWFDAMGLHGKKIVIDGRNTYEQIAALFAAMAMGAVAAPLALICSLKTCVS